MTCLLDVNALIALVDTDHVDHEPMNRWFRTHHAKGWATCAITENGTVRVLSQPSYPSGQRTPADVIHVLTHLKTMFADHHEFWPDEVSLSDETLFDPAFIIRSKQVTDAYLLGLAASRKGIVASFDRKMPWQAVRGASPKLIQLPV